MEAREKILAVEDDGHIARLISMHLEDLGYDVTCVGTVAEGKVQSVRDDYDLLILDLVLPDGDGMEICKSLRSRGINTPILILTARAAEVDRVLGLEFGADDYLTKPFGIRELVARVRAILRRVEMLARDPSSVDAIRVAGLEIDPQKRSVSVAGRHVALTAREFDLLLHFAKQPGRVYTRSDLLDRVWGYGAGCYEHTVNSHINRLRGKIEDDPGDPQFIETVWGVGYRFRDPNAAHS